MPSGWPSAIAPPLTLTRSRSRPSSFSTARYCAANASLTSIRSMSASVSPARFEHHARRRRGAHAHQRRIDADGRPGVSRASGFSRGLHAVSDARSSAAPPSTMPCALPAVTQPFLLNAAGSFASPSIVVSGRM